MPTRKSKAARRKSTSRSAGRARSKPKRAVSAARPKRAVARRPAAAHRPAAPKPAAASSPSAIGLVSHHLDYTSHDLEGVKRFYTEVLGFKDFNQDPRFNMPPMPGPPEQWRPPREPALYFIVKDVDRTHRQLSLQGIQFEQAPQDMPWGQRVAILRDPEGRTVCLAQGIA
ncbi:MAG: hypothetical protein E6K73_08470 [Candidatus Eisenbacteria bacterium]|uniref:VOC domain-containing protein n=1 Tax=Eiseniibacteriota bacterium TaxID=2212470 RepID=A0A538SFK7_UNCEI|nr:MAG: hypothetical protein E6K73_08470 [Candidatus Eisenbacteria bacterium]